MKGQLPLSSAPAHKISQMLFTAVAIRSAGRNSAAGSSALKCRACAQNASDAAATLNFRPPQHLSSKVVVQCSSNIRYSPPFRFGGTRSHFSGHRPSRPQSAYIPRTQGLQSSALAFQAGYRERLGETDGEKEGTRITDQLRKKRRPRTDARTPQAQKEKGVKKYERRREGGQRLI